MNLHLGRVPCRRHIQLHVLSTRTFGLEALGSTSNMVHPHDWQFGRRWLGAQRSSFHLLVASVHELLELPYGWGVWV